MPSWCSSGATAIGDQPDIFSGFIAASIVMVVVSLVTSPPPAVVSEEFDQAAKLNTVFKSNENVDIETAAAQVKKN